MDALAADETRHVVQLSMTGCRGFGGEALKLLLRHLPRRAAGVTCVGQSPRVATCRFQAAAGATTGPGLHGNQRVGGPRGVGSQTIFDSSFSSFRIFRIFWDFRFRIFSDFRFWISGDAAVAAAHVALHGLTAEGRLRAEPAADADAAIAGALVLQLAAARLGGSWVFG